MYEQNVLSGHNKVIQAHVQSRATGIEDKGHHVLRAVVGARPDLRIAPHVTMVRSTCRARPGAGRNSEPGPQSLQSASEAQLHVSAQMGGGGGKRRPQSAQSEP